MAILQSNGLVLFQRVEPIKITLFLNGSLFGKRTSRTGPSKALVGRGSLLR